jgi:hypothetical protein
MGDRDRAAARGRGRGPRRRVAHLLSSVPYERVRARRIDLPPRPPAVDDERPQRALFRQVPDHSAALTG